VKGQPSPGDAQVSGSSTVSGMRAVLLVGCFSLARFELVNLLDGIIASPLTSTLRSHSSLGIDDVAFLFTCRLVG
jgi:hypothetical protein